MATAAPPVKLPSAAEADGVAAQPATVETLVSRTRSCALRPAQYFCAWQGVLTLAYDGFPPALEALKAELTAHHPAALPAENPGSRWPKTTLGALRDGTRLTPTQLRALHAVCAAHSARLAVCEAVRVSELRLVLFACRSLERTVSSQRLPLASPPDDAPPSAAARAAAAATLSEFDEDKLEQYWVHVARDGSRETHYRADASGATLVAPLPPAAVAATDIAAFRAAVDAALPGLYRWFADDSLHVTVRALL